MLSRSQFLQSGFLPSTNFIKLPPGTVICVKHRKTTLDQLSGREHWSFDCISVINTQATARLHKVMNINKPSDMLMVLPFYRPKNKDQTQIEQKQRRAFSWMPNKVRNHFVAWAGEFVG